MSKEIRFKSVVAAALLKFGEIDNLDISLLLEDLKKESYYISYRYYLEELSKFVMIGKDGRITTKLSLESVISEDGTSIREELEKVVVDDICNYFDDLDVKQFRKRKEEFLKEQWRKVLIINDKGETLLQKRSANKRFDPNKWALCAGHVDAGEKLIDAAIRETEEELGIKLSKDDVIPFLNKEITREKTNSHITYFYYTKCNLEEDQFIIQEDELSEVKWFLIDDVIKMIKTHDSSIVFKGNRLDLFRKLKDIK